MIEHFNKLTPAEAERLALLLEVKPYWLDPSDKLTVIQRISDGYDPSCNVYRHQVKPFKPGKEP